MRRGFLTAGTWVVDRNISVDHWPAEDGLGIVSDVVLRGGGSACNFAADMRRLAPEVPVETSGLVGADDLGDLLVEVARAHGLDTAGLVRTDGAPTMTTDAYLSRRTLRRTHILFPGTAALLTPEHVPLEASRARTLHLGLPGIHPAMDGPWQGEPSGWCAVLKRARAHGFETNFELVSAAPERIRELVGPCLPHLTTLVCNDIEIGALATLQTVAGGVPDGAACEAAARAVLDRGAMDLVVVHHPGGAILVARDGTVLRQPSVAVPATERVGANGAGDAFAAGFHLGRHQGRAWQACLALAHAAAAASLRSAGTYDAVESAEACLALAARWGWRS